MKVPFQNPRLTLTQQYFLFCLAISVLPILFMSFLFLDSSNKKLGERLSSQLHMGAMLAEGTYRNDLEDLQIGTEQAALFSLSRDLSVYYKTGNKRSLNNYLKRYQQLRHLDVALIKISPGQIPANAPDIEPVYKDSYSRLLQEAFQGRTVSSIEALQSRKTKQSMMAYVSMAPIIFEGQPGKVQGVFITGRSLAKELSFMNLVKVLPLLEARVLIKQPTDKRYQVLSYSDSSFARAIPEEKSLALSEKTASNSKVFQETIKGQTFKSQAAPLKDYAGNTIGYLVVSTSEKDLALLRQENLIWLGIYLVLLIIFVLLAEMWFQRVFISPMESLVSASTKVSQGDLGTRITNDQAQPEMRRVITSFNTMLKQLDETERLRMTFVSTLTHDLRTPVTAQKRVLESLEEMKADLPPEVAGVTTGLLKNNEQLLDMINKLLEASQYEAGTIQLYLESVNLHLLVEESIQSLLPLSEAKRIGLINSIPARLPLIQADRQQLKRVFINLLNNAIENIGHYKTVGINAQDVNGHVTIQVEDNGPGIPEELLPYLFKRYFIGHKTRQKIGSGLGLFICRMIIELHGGQITARNRSGSGTCFTITLPKEADHHDASDKNL